MDNHLESVLYNCSIPNIKDLYEVKCEVNWGEILDSSAKSKFHWQTMKCRLIIFLIPEIIASPIYGYDNLSISVITPIDYFIKGELQAHLRNLNISVFGKPKEVRPEIYQACLSYTIKAKIAPLWNNVQDYYIEGKDFYLSKDALNSVKMGITIADNLVQLKIQAEKVKIATLQLEDFNLPKLLIADFLADSNGYISLKSFCSQWVYVLPSMKKGRVLSISKQLPPQSIFADYTQLRRHWKNMYGYRLPTTADNILFYEIQFPVPNPYSFIYPHICLAFKPLKSFKCPDLRSTAFKFIQDMVSTLSKICGKLIVINQIEEKCNLRQSIIKGNAVEKSLFTPKRLSLPRFSEIICQEGRSQINEIFTPGLEFSAKYKNPLLPLTHQKIKTAEKSTSESSQLSVGKESTEGQASFSNSKSTDSSTLQKYKADDKVKGRTIVIPKERDISRYFKQQKASSSIDNNTQTTKYKKYKKESGLNLSSLSNNILKTRDNYIKIMTDLNKLNEVTISTLKLWLNDHSIPYKSKDSKAILINNILSHIKTSKPSL